MAMCVFACCSCVGISEPLRHYSLLELHTVHYFSSSFIEFDIFVLLLLFSLFFRLFISDTHESLTELLVFN